MLNKTNPLLPVLNLKPDSTPLWRLSCSKFEVNLDSFNPFGSTVYIIKGSIKYGKHHENYIDICTVGIYLSH